MVAVLLHLVSPIDTRKRKLFCNTIIINVLQPIEKEPSAGKFNKKNTQKDKSFCCKYLNINKNSFYGSQTVIVTEDNIFATIVTCVAAEVHLRVIYHLK